MKLVNYVWAIVCLSIIFASCNESPAKPEEEEKPVATLSVTPTSLDVGAEGGTLNITINSNATWNITSSATWCTLKISRSFYEGDFQNDIYVQANDLEEIRTATLTISVEGADDVTVSVSQAAKEPEPQEPEEPEKPLTIAPDDTDMRTNLTAIEFSKLMGVGWNLGNSLEALNASNGVLSGGETSWGNPVVTKQLIDAVKAAGFNAVRIPVSWSHKLIDESTYKISWLWKQRVAEVVDYVIDNDMYAIINVHWDGGWSDHPDYAHQEEINKKLGAFWRQIAIYFRDYDDHLLFAGTNEVHVEGNYNAPTTENAEVQNSFNQTFIDTVRATGGRNTYRHLIVQGYNTNITYTKDYLVIPTDPTNDRMMVEVHFYDPYQFALKEDAPYNTGWGTGHTDVSDWGQESWVDEAFGYMKTNFVDKGYPVVLGEYGAVRRTDLTGAALQNHISSLNYYLEYVTKKAVDNGMVPVYWDNGHNGNNGFALFDRDDGAILHSDAIEAITKALN